jgi:hypothetical protein
MGDRNLFFSLGSYVREYMGECIQKYALVEGDGPGGVMTLSNAHCIISLEDIDENYVRFDFASTLAPDVQYSLPDFLDVAVEGGTFKHRPKPSDDWDSEAQFKHYVVTYNTLLLAGAMDAPLSGDFSWAPRVAEYLAEEKELGSRLLEIRKSQHPESSVIWRKRSNYDLTWMDDVRRILAEQESQS